MVLEGVIRLLDPLRRFVRREFEHQGAEWLLTRNELSVDDIVGSTLMTAIEQAETAPVTDGLYRWLRQLARGEVRRTRDAYRDEQHSELSVETPLSRVGVEWPDHIRRLKNIMADPAATLPEEVVEHEETAAVLAEALGRLPEQWREVFLLHAVDGWTNAEIADVEGLDAAEALRIAQASRAFVHAWVEDNTLIEGS
jgi:RNA polymerase sigma factor (sigma-70 family)